MFNFTLFSPTEKEVEKTTNTTFNIVSVSRLEPVKNIEGIIKVLHQLKYDNFKIKYTIVGDGSSKTDLENLVKKLHLQKEVHFAGFQENTKKYYLDSDLYVLNSFSEGFSNSLLEAMYLKIPSITTAVGAASESIEDTKNGWIVAVNNESELYQKIKNCIQLEAQERIKIGNNAHATVMEKFSLQNHVNVLLQLYTSKL